MRLARRRWTGMVLSALAAMSVSCGTAAVHGPAANPTALGGGGAVPGPALVTPRALSHVHAVPWNRVVGTTDGRTLTVSFTGGQPGGRCNALAGVTVHETPAQVEITVLLGDESTDAVCPLVAVVQETQVEMSAPLGNRAVVDTTTGKPHPVATPQS